MERSVGGINKSRPSSNAPCFLPGESVVLANGTYQGTPGTFVALRNDENWADIRECNGHVRSHPIAWIKRGAISSGLDFAESRRTSGVKTGERC